MNQRPIRASSAQEKTGARMLQRSSRVAVNIIDDYSELKSLTAILKAMGLRIAVQPL